MKLVTRQWILGVGTALLVGGWGVTGCAKEQQKSALTDMGFVLWGGTVVTSARSKTIYACGVLSMAVGAGLIGFAIYRPRDRSDGGRTE